jgi:hypothetical protein
MRVRLEQSVRKPFKLIIMCIKGLTFET